MTREELERRLNEAEKQNLSLLNEVKSLKAKLMDIKDEPEIPDMPHFKCGEEVLFVNSDLETVCDSLMTPSIEIDFNTFHTTAYADKFRRKCLMIAMMLHCKWYLDREYVPDWDNKFETKFCVIFNFNMNSFQLGVQYSEEHGDVYFSTQEAAQKCANWMNEHWVK